MLAVELFLKNGINKILIPGVGYGRNAKVFLDKGFEVTGIEIAKSAIDLARANGMNFKIHQGSVTSMPFDDEKYEGIFCYALLHLLNKSERKNFLKACYKQLLPGGMMIFTIVSVDADMYGKGKKLSKDRFEVEKGISVFFYNSENIEKEFGPCGLQEYRSINEPIKFADGYDPLKCMFVICKKL